MFAFGLDFGGQWRICSRVVVDFNAIAFPGHAVIVIEFRRLVDQEGLRSGPTVVDHDRAGAVFALFKGLDPPAKLCIIVLGFIVLAAVVVRLNADLLQGVDFNVGVDERDFDTVVNFDRAIVDLGCRHNLKILLFDRDDRAAFGMIGL
ncbi:MAG: hypothetical protein JJ992_29900, partial [Planctomycetes bacterium]|nr:hypothetical protein [Planctomycetota bacterium]